MKQKIYFPQNDQEIRGEFLKLIIFIKLFSLKNIINFRINLEMFTNLNFIYF